MKSYKKVIPNTFIIREFQQQQQIYCFTQFIISETNHLGSLIIEAVLWYICHHIRMLSQYFAMTYT